LRLITIVTLLFSGLYFVDILKQCF
jgi:hypothetical protein